MNIIKIIVGLVLLYAIIRAGIEEGGNAKGMFPAIIIVILVIGLGYIVYVNYFKNKKPGNGTK